MNIARFFIRRPVFSIVLSILAVIAGLFVLRDLPIAQYPDITPPTVQVTASYPGADPQLIATTVGAPIEEAVNGVENMIYMSSSSTQGAYSLTITFEVGTDIDMATVHVQNKLNTVTSTLPESVQQQGVTVAKSATNMLVIFSLLSEQGQYDDLFLSNYASLNLQDPLARVEGVGNVMLFGSSKYSIRVWMDPEILRVRRVSASDIYNAIAAQNLQSASGSVGQAPNDKPVAFEYTLLSPGQLESVKEFEEIIVRSTETGQYLRLGDVARIELGSQSYTTTSHLNGAPCAMIAISQTPGANALDVADGVLNEMEQLAEYLPEGVSYEVALNTTQFITDSIEEVIITFIETLLIVVAVILLFLQNWRAVIIPAIAIPVSLIATFVIMGILGFSLNLLTLFSLVLAIAIVVDDAIVVVENADRIMEEDAQAGRKVSIERAVEQGVGELISPIISIDLCMLAVFIPSSFISGITGQLIRQFALTIAASTIISGFVSITLTPTLCAMLLKRRGKGKKNIIYRAFDAGYAQFAKIYDKCMSALLKHPVWTFILFLLLSVPSLLFYKNYPTTFLPSEDQGYFMVMVQLPDGATSERTQEVMDEVSEHIVKTMPEVENYVEVSGYSMMGGASNNSGMIWVVLKPWSERKEKGMSADALVRKVNADAYLGIPGATIYAVNPPPIEGLGVSGGLTIQLQDINNLGSQSLYEAYLTLLENADQAPDIAQMNSFYSPNVPQYKLNIDRSRLRLLGLTYQDVAHTLSYYLGTAYVNDYIQFGRTWQVILGGETSARADLDDMLQISIVNNQGDPVPLSSFISFDYNTAPASLTRYNMYESASIDLSLKEKASSGEAIKETETLIKNQLGTNFGFEWTGTALQELESGSSIYMIFALAFVLVYLVLAAQYESWTASISVLISVPLAVLGVVLGCWLFDLPISVYTQIGLILLIALSAKNAILIVAFAREARQKGTPIKQAALDGGNIRLRPIMMTSLSFVLGVIPLLFATGAGAASRLSLGVAVVFGMAVNALLGTLFVPNFFEWMQRLEERFRKSASSNLVSRLSANDHQEDTYNDRNQ